MQNRVVTVDEPDVLSALAHPIRRRMLGCLRAPDTAAGIARELQLPRQQVNYHLKTLEQAKLVQPAGERRKGHLIEKLFEAVAGSLVFSPTLVWDGAERQQALRDQASLGHLVNLGRRIQEDTNALLDRAAFDGEIVPSAAVTAQVGFADEADRAAFMEEYLQLLGPLLDKYGTRGGAAYQVALAVYPETPQSEEAH